MCVCIVHANLLKSVVLQIYGLEVGIGQCYAKNRREIEFIIGKKNQFDFFMSIVEMEALSLYEFEEKVNLWMNWEWKYIVIVLWLIDDKFGFVVCALFISYLLIDC